jgi:hypothetical protein
MRKKIMRFKFFYFLVFFQLIILGTGRAQVFDLECDLEYRYTYDTFHNPIGVDGDSSSSKISAVPIVAFGSAGLFTGGIIGARIDQGGPLEITKAEMASMAIGTAVGVTVGYILAKRAQKSKQSKEK